MIPADEALRRLQQGNEAFRTGTGFHLEAETLLKLNSQKDQKPFAIILGCSDSRVPAEIVFGQSIGDLFVIRVAGNIVAPSQIASIEFAAENFGTRLVVVLGHSRCGAVQATLDQLVQPVENRSPHLYSIVDRIRPAVENLLETESEEDLMSRAVRSNIEASVHKLESGSDILKDLVSEKGLMIVGAEYCLDTGLVDFFE
ncbi:MAG: carbonic anhydrase [Pseudohongiella sp.]|nr:MAG: carbonic anhydrase [Pseudohongiella sp.]